MKKILLFLPALLLLMAFTRVSAQTVKAAADTSQYPYWITMMQDPNANFFQIQSAFNKYWENRPITRGCGWKPFKRWESMMQPRVSPDGRMPAPDAVRNAYNEYMAQHDNAKSASGTWVSQGPFDLPSKGYRGLGRINAIAFHPTDPSTIYIGAPAGGLWVSTTGGNDWTTTTDGLPTLGVSAIAIDPHDPNIIYIGTGDRDASDAPGVGVMKSIDNGATWQSANTGMGNRIVGDLLIDNNNSQIIYAGTTSGFFKSTDAGATWVEKGGSFKDICFKPGNTNIIYGSQTGSFYRSTDAGENWVQITAGLADGARGVIAVTPANPEIVYYLLAQGDNGFKGLYRSTDAGLTFTEMSNSPNIMDWSCDGSGSGGQAWYDLALAADPVNPNIIYTGGVNVWKSTDGGANWQINAHWYGGCGVPAVHADQHIFTVNPLNGKVYIGNDGGIYWTGNGGAQWVEISTGLAISEAYKIGQSATIDDMVANGYQDNGTSLYDGGVWVAIGGGDGMECAIDQVNPMYRYTTVYYGAINRVIGTSAAQIAGNGVNGITEEGAWVTPFILDAADPNIMFIGYKNVWRSVNIKNPSASGVKWVKISTINTGNLEVLKQSPVNRDLLYASSGSALYISTNALQESPTWVNLTSRLPSVTTISAIETSPYDENTVYLVQDKKVYKSTDRAITWTDISGGLPAIHYSSIVYYKNSQEGLYLGSDAGVYYKDNSLADWVPFSAGLPAAVKATELEIFYDPTSPAGDRIKAGTFGRGMWKSDMYTVAPTADFSADQRIIPPGCQVSFKDLSLGVPFQWAWSFPGASPVNSTVKNPSGIEYGAVGAYDVQLKVTNNAGTHTLVKPGYIVVSDTIKPVPGFKASPLAFCDMSQVVQFTDTTKSCPYAWNWSFSPNTVTYENGTNANSQNPQVSFSQPGSYTVTLQAGNSNGARTLIKTDYIMAGGYYTPFTDNFENSTFDSKGWTIENPDNLVTWSITTVGGNSPGNKAAWMNFFNYPTPPGHRDRMITPPLNFTGTSPVFMTFEHAYADRFTSMSDSLIIYISEDCGTSWVRIFAAGEKDNGAFATVPKQTTSFTPAVADDWCGGGWGSKCNVIDLTAWANKPNIKIAFEGYNRFGNNLYIDNINISSTTAIGEYQPADHKIMIYPNPTSGLISIYSGQNVEDLTVSFFNAQGSLVMTHKIKATSHLLETMDMSSLAKGVYLVKINGNHTLEQQKLIIR
ncbi:MAG: T9SS type A sorting domain-containing protein [Bacteroidota bacterium]